MAKWGNSDYRVKFVMIGDVSVGKSSLLMRYCDEGFLEEYVDTIGADFRKKCISLDEEMISQLIFDIAGLRRWRAITDSYYKGADGVMIVYDVTNMESFRLIQNFLEECTRYAKTDIRILIVGNKCDLDTDRVVPYSMAKELADKVGIPFIETSAKDSTNVEQVFLALTLAVRDKLHAMTRPGVGTNYMTYARTNTGKLKPVVVCCSTEHCELKDTNRCQN